MRFDEAISGGEGETSEKKKIKELKRRSAESEPTVWIGKNGVTNALLKQISGQLEANEMVKVKVHRTSLKDEEIVELADKIADETASKVVDVRGRTFTLYKQRKTRQARQRVTG